MHNGMHWLLPCSASLPPRPYLASYLPCPCLHCPLPRRYFPRSAAHQSRPFAARCLQLQQIETAAGYAALLAILLCVAPTRTTSDAVPPRI